MDNSVPFELQPELPATPLSLLSLGETFERFGYHKLARHLRAAADQLAAHPHREVHAVLVATRYDEHVAGSRYGVTLKGSDAAVHDVRLGTRYALVPLGDDPVDPRQQHFDPIAAAVLPESAGAIGHDDDRR